MSSPKVEGVFRGKVPEGPREPPPPLPVVPTPRVKLGRGERAGSSAMTVDQAVTAMVVAFVAAVGERRGAGLRRRVDHEWRGTVRLMASDLIDEGISPEAYVQYVCEGVRKLRRREPYAGEVFSLRTLKSRPMQAWLRGYRKNAYSYLPLPTYSMTPARLRMHKERVKACRLPPPAPTT